MHIQTISSTVTMHTQSIIPLLATTILLSSCASSPVTPRQSGDSIIGKWDCLTTTQIHDDELAVNMTFKHRDTFTKNEWTSSGKGHFTIASSMGQGSFSTNAFGTKSHYEISNQSIHSTLQELNPILSKAQAKTTDKHLEDFMDFATSAVNLSLKQDIANKKTDIYEITELTPTTLKIKTNDPELQPTEHTLTTCTRLK